MNRVSILIASIAAGIAVCSLASPASAQSSRTWVSGVGDDANPCSRTAPCKTWAGAISKTATGGEIDVLDPGGFGAVTITKSITIDGGGFPAGALTSAGVSGIIVNATSTSTVILRNLQVSGPGARGLYVVAAKSVTLQNVDIYGMAGCGVCVQASPAAKVRIDNSRISNNTGDGVLVTATGGVGNRVTVHGSSVAGNGGAGVHVGPASGTSYAYAFVYGNLIVDNNDGILDDGTSSNIRISDNDISGNVTGLRTLNSGKILSFQDNRISANNTDGVPTGTLSVK